MPAAQTLPKLVMVMEHYQRKVTWVLPAPCIPALPIPAPRLSWGWVGQIQENRTGMTGVRKEGKLPLVKII